MVLRSVERGWKTLGRKQAEYMYNRLREVRDTATMQNASFGMGDEADAFTKKVREETRIWRQSWIISPLDRAIAELKEVYKFR